jgi:hypothetical protein
LELLWFFKDCELPFGREWQELITSARIEVQWRFGFHSLESRLLKPTAR